MKKAGVDTVDAMPMVFQYGDKERSQVTVSASYNDPHEGLIDAPGVHLELFSPGAGHWLKGRGQNADY